MQGARDIKQTPAANTGVQLRVLLGPQALGHQRNRETSSGVLETSLPMGDTLPGLSCWKCREGV